MPRKPVVPKVGSHALGGDAGLTVKDGLREVRFNVRHGARKLVEAVEAATHRHEDAAQGPFGLLGEPLNLAVRTAATLLNNVDHAAVDFLSPDADYRAMTVPLRSSSAYFLGSDRASGLRTFATDHLWRYRHWLEMSPHADVFVHEHGIAMAGSAVLETVSADSFMSTNDGDSDADLHRRTTAPIVLALLAQPILSTPALATEGEEDGLAALASLGAVVVVLAGEVARCVKKPIARDRYAGALRLADEIAVADRKGWEAAWHSHTPAAAVGRWFAFVLHHV